MYDDAKESIKHLSEEVEGLRNQNMSKESLINEVKIEREILVEKLEELKKENERKKDDTAEEEFVDNSECLSVELGRIDAFYAEVRFDCDSCGEFFSCKKTLRNHEEEHLKSSLKTKEL